MNTNNSYQQQRRSRSKITLIVLIVCIYLLGVSTYDAFIGTPKKTEKVEQVLSAFGEFKTYIDAKLPQMDSALMRHEAQLEEQNNQLQELNKLTSILKEENNE